MTPFSYERARSVGSATAAARLGAAYLAGGTCLLDLMKQGVERPDHVIDLGPVAELAEIRLTACGDLRLGSMAVLSHVARHRDVGEHWPLLAQTIAAGLTPQLRNAATIGGNIMQRPRCIYFRDPGFDCNKKTPGSGCAAKAGVHFGHALFGGAATDACIAVHPSDLCVALCALHARVAYRTAEDACEHAVSIESFLRLPGSEPGRETELPPGALVTAIEVPPQGKQGGAYAKGPEGGFALASAAVVLGLQQGLIARASVVLGGVAHKPWRVRDAERALLDRVPSLDLFTAADTQTAFRVVLLKALIVEALTRSAAQAEARA